MKPEEIYRKIDKIDRELLVLLQERMGYVLRSNKFKQTVRETPAAEDMLTRFEQLNLDLMERSFTKQVLKTIIDETKRLQQENRLLTDTWWLEPEYEYGKIVFTPKNMTPEELSERCATARRQFFSFSSMLKRGTMLFHRHPPCRLFAAYWLQNLNLKQEVDGKLGLPIGDGLDELPK